VAPPERTARSPTASFLPPAPTLSSSRARVNREPEITHMDTSDDEAEAEEEEEEADEQSEGEGLEKKREKPKGAILPLRFGPPKGPPQSGQSKDVVSSVDSRVMYFIVILSYLLFLLHIDLANLPPLERQPPANGSSRSTGGIIRGHALGNAPNIGDPFDDVQQDVRPLSRGRVNVTIVQHPPEDIVIENPTSHLKVMSPCYETLAPLLKKVAKSYSPVRSKYSIN